MIEAVDSVLVEVGAAERPRVLCLNKVDLLDAERQRELSYRHPGAIQVSARTGEGFEELRTAVERRFEATLRPVELLLPYEQGARLSELHTLAGALEREDTPEGVRVRARLPVGALPRFRAFAVPGGAAFGVDGSAPDPVPGAELEAPALPTEEPTAEEPAAEEPRVAGAGGR
jgi:GTP-binding protein HflX